MLGRPLTRAIIRRLLTAESWTQFLIGLCVVCGGQVGIGTGFCGSTLIFPPDYHSKNAQCTIFKGVLEHYR